MVIDFSAHDTWEYCPAAWFEKYVNRRRKKWPKGQRDDALCLGSLVHEGLRVWQTDHVVAIPDAVVDEVTPTRETYNLALELVYGYAQAYPQEAWPLIRCEEPLIFPLQRGGTVTGCERCDHQSYDGVECPEHDMDDVRWWKVDELQGLAKIDAYFYVPEETVVESGLPGLQTVLTPGWWIHEYKTKHASVSIPLYMQSWEMGLQASYQTMALQHNLDNNPSQFGAIPPHETHHQVQGVLVNVLEKPRRSVPKRKCKSCDEYYEFATWLPTGTGEYRCPVCANSQKLQPLRQDGPTDPPKYFRLAVTRNTAELERDRQLMLLVGQRMIDMERNGLHSEEWRHKNCANTFNRKVCDYFGPHFNNSSTADDPDYETPPDYRGLTQIEEAA